MPLLILLLFILLLSPRIVGLLLVYLLVLVLLPFRIQLVHSFLLVLVLVFGVPPVPLAMIFIILIMTMTDKEDDKSPSLDNGDFSKNVQMINLIMGYFLHLKPSFTSHSDDLIPWLDVFGNTRLSSRVVLKMFEKLKLKEVDKKFCWAAEDKKKLSSALPQWGQVYRLGEQEKFNKAPKVNESVSSPEQKD